MTTKFIRIGNTEILIIYLLKYWDEFHLAFSKKELASFIKHAWNTNGFYNSNMTMPVDVIGEDTYLSYITPDLVSYFLRYECTLYNSTTLALLDCSLSQINRALSSNFSSNDLLKHLSPGNVLRSAPYRDIESDTKNKDVLVVSPFAELMMKQHHNGNLNILRPNFRPTTIQFYKFPYCFNNTGPHNTSFHTISFVTNEITKTLKSGAHVLLGCGSMGAFISDHLHKAGYNTWYWGGDLQIYFGIMGKRWKGRGFTSDNVLLGSYLTNRSLWIDEIPESDKPTQFKTIEGGCYW